MTAILVTFIVLTDSAWASPGDRSEEFRTCRLECEENYHMCNESLSRRDTSSLVMDRVFGWCCEQECFHLCMWRTVSAAGAQKFSGRWPLTRHFGMIEPASAIASFATFATSAAGFIWFLINKCEPHSKFKWSYYSMFVVMSFTWLSSTLFHIRDYVLFERMDYYGAFLYVLIPAFWLSCRAFYPPASNQLLFSLAGLLLMIISYVSYMELVKFDHTLHYQLCFLLSFVQFVVYASCLWIRRSRPVKERLSLERFLLVFAVGAVGPIGSKYFDRTAPFLWTFDSHSLMHIGLIPAPLVFWWAIAAEDQLLNSDTLPTKTSAKLD